jgi:hypothetical protein
VGARRRLRIAGDQPAEALAQHAEIGALPQRQRVETETPEGQRRIPQQRHCIVGHIEGDA